MTAPSTESSTLRVQRPVVFATVLGGGVCLFATIAGLVLIGLMEHAAQDSITALATIGGALAGAFGGWMARGAQQRRGDDA